MLKEANVSQIYIVTGYTDKRLENGAFQWPRNKSEARQLTREQFVWLMQGLSIDQPKAIKRVKPKSII